jgi:hypothetical protein
MAADQLADRLEDAANLAMEGNRNGVIRTLHAIGLIAQASVRRKITSAGMPRHRANRLRSLRRKETPASLRRCAEISARRPLLGTPIRSSGVLA